ncbi:SNARE associated Golgi protein [Grimontia celer]|uniref:SNARE associated Golgi protein n=1 Tax=Grimontia celer TaxID=1796497 RepID=A0A128EXA9_9GAMM|nr:VTT domain-containing protein [Grimontia celer]CZF79229.1 SNARE associated Golgi protein [Grimontia celer]
MSSLFKLMGIMALFFASTFIAVNAMGWLTVDQIQLWFEQAQSLSALTVAIIVVSLLFLDLFIAVPTLSIMILGGYFAGAYVGALAAFTGTLLAGIAGYVLSAKFGDKLVNVVVKDEKQRAELRGHFRQHGVLMILLSRAMPILPEVTACMSGISRMKFTTFLLAWCTVNLPYTFIAAYAGSISSLENPKPAILTAIALSVFFWIGWGLLRRFSLKRPIRAD